jgi:hypothetical protein
VRTSILVGPHPPVSALLQLPDVDHPHRATADPRGTLTHTGQDLCPDLALPDGTEPGQGRFLLALGLHQEDEEAAETALVVMEVEEGEARVTAATAVMMTGAGAGVVDEAGVVDVEQGISDLDFSSAGVWDEEKIVKLPFSRYQMKLFPRAASFNRLCSCYTLKA